MPLVKFDDTYYNHPSIYGGEFGGYNRANKDNLYNLCRDGEISQVLGLKPGDSILFVGSGFGWIEESWQEQGLGPICSVDTSEWIQQNTVTNSVVTIHSYDVTNLNDQLSIKSVLGLTATDMITWCITDVINTLSDEECLTLTQALRSISLNVVHRVVAMPNDIPGLLTYNWKSLAEWKSLLDPDKLLVFYRNTLI